MRAVTSVVLVLLALATLAPAAPAAVVVRSPIDDGIDLSTPSSAHWLFWGLTSLVRDWVAGRAENGGILLSLAEWQKDFGVGGRYFPSMSFAEISLRPRLVVVFTSPTGPAP